MMELITRTARLVPYAKRPKQVPSFVAANVYEPAADDPTAQFGNLFIVVEALVSGRPGEDVASLITSSFQSVYYDAASTAASSLERFEAATKAANTALSEYVNQGNAAWIGKLSAVVAVQAGSELHLTHSGSAEAYLYRGRASTRITAGDNPRSPGPAKTFGLVASGNLEVGDRLLLATPALIHQLSLKKLHEISSDSSPNAAISEFMQLLKGSDTTRVAALVIEVTTPELAALQLRTDEPDDITMGAPETPLEAAKLMATPIAAATLETGRRASQAAQAGWSQTRPQLQRAGQAAVHVSRAVKGGDRLARRGLAALIAVAAVIGLLVWYQGRSHAAAAVVNSYNHDYATYTAAQTVTDTNARRAQLTSVQTDLTKLMAAHRSNLDTTLAHATLDDGAPKTAEALAASIADALDVVDNVVKVTPSTVDSLSSSTATRSSLMEVVGSSIYLINTSNSDIFVVNKSTKSVTKESVDTSKVGRVIATAAASTNDGIYLLTPTPSVWFYRPSTNTLSDLTLGQASWEHATAIASYGGNLYVLSGNQIIKHVRTSTGFSAGTPYLSNSSSALNPHTLTVDGYVYVEGSDGLHQYLGGVAKATIPNLPELTKVTSLRSTSSGQLVGVSQASGRIAIWSDATTIAYVRQYQLSGISHLNDAVYDQASGVYYALADNKVVTFAPSN